MVFEIDNEKLQALNQQTQDEQLTLDFHGFAKMRRSEPENVEREFKGPRDLKKIADLNNLVRVSAFYTTQHYIEKFSSH
jgi:hypothetical protein